MDEGGAEDYLYHYNILRPVEIGGRCKSSSIADRALVTGAAISFGRDLMWNEIARRRIGKTAVILVAPKRVILRRARQRLVVESRALLGRKESSYPCGYWSEVIERVELAALYRGWCDELRRHDIPYLMVDSSDADYRVLGDDELERLLTCKSVDTPPLR